MQPFEEVVSARRRERAEGGKEKNTHLIREPAPAADALRLAIVDDPMSDDCVILQGRQCLGK